MCKFAYLFFPICQLYISLAHVRKIGAGEEWKHLAYCIVIGNILYNQVCRNYFSKYKKEISKNFYTIWTDSLIKHKTQNLDVGDITEGKWSDIFLVAVRKGGLEILESISSLVYTSNKAVIKKERAHICMRVRWFLTW